MVGDEQISSLQTAFSIPVGASLRPAGAAASVSGRGWGCGGWGVCGITQWHVLPCRQLNLGPRHQGNLRIKRDWNWKWPSTLSKFQSSRRLKQIKTGRWAPTSIDARRWTSWEKNITAAIGAEKCVLNFASQWYNYYYYPTCAGNYYKNAVLFFFLLKLCHLFFMAAA